MIAVPKQFEGLLWSRNMHDLDAQEDKIYITHQILAFGSLRHIRKLLRFYGKEEVAHTFLAHPKKMYPAAVFYFVKNFILPLHKMKLPEEKYVKIPLARNWKVTA